MSFIGKTNTPYRIQCSLKAKSAGFSMELDSVDIKHTAPVPISAIAATPSKNLSREDVYAKILCVIG
jgi:hypothetical protein